MKNGRNILKFLCCLCLLQILLTVYFILKVYVSNVMRPDLVSETQNNGHYNLDFEPPEEFVFEGFMKNEPQENGNGIGREVLRIEEEIPTKRFKRPVIEIWAKAAIGSYLWEHILGGTKSVDLQNPSIYFSELLTSRWRLNYKEGPGLQLETAPVNITRLVIILNGRTPEKAKASRQWLNRIASANPSPKTVLVILGNERCQNSWIQRYLAPKGPLRGVFITYDDSSIDDQNIFQWPLGVATYRHFPSITRTRINPSKSRKYMCNIQATNYPNSSRSSLFSLLMSSNFLLEHCVVKPRTKWSSSETPQSSEDYVHILLQSDLTLCPAGFNTETYRVYEAISAGSVPVIEDTHSKGSCDPLHGWRLLKSFDPPVIWVKSWEELPTLLANEVKMTEGEKIRRRKKLINWYEWFNLRNQDRFLSFLSDVF